VDVAELNNRKGSPSDEGEEGGKTYNNKDGGRSVRLLNAHDEFMRILDPPPSETEALPACSDTAGMNLYGLVSRNQGAASTTRLINFHL